jgi:hypothetical protein
MQVGAFEHLKVVHVAPDGTASTTYALGAGTTDVNSSAVDALGFDKIAFLVTFGDNADTATYTGTIEGSANGSTGWTEITSANDSFTAGAADTDNEMLGVQCKVNPSYRYYRLASNRGTANTVIAALHALLSNGDNLPVTQSTAAGNFINTPTIVP